MSGHLQKVPKSHIFPNVFYENLPLAKEIFLKVTFKSNEKLTSKSNTAHSDQNYNPDNQRQTLSAL